MKKARTVRFQEDVSTEDEDLLKDDESFQSPVYTYSKEDNVSVEDTFALLDHLGYRWGHNSKYWMMWTLWEFEVLDLLCPISIMTKKRSFPLNNNEFNRIINRGFDITCSDPTFKYLEPQLAMGYLVIRLDMDENQEPFSILSEMVELKATEVIFKSRKACLCLDPIYLIACAGLAEILRATCKNSDLLIVSGTYKRVYSNEGKCLLLMNFENPKGQLQILRLPLANLEEIYMVEKIKPSNIDNRFQFTYFVREGHNLTRKEITKHQDFKWVNSSQEPDGLRKRSALKEEFTAPIQNDQNPFDVYNHLVSENFHLVPTYSSTEYPPIKTSKKSVYKNKNPEIDDEFDYQKDSPVFFSQSPELNTPGSSTTPASRFTRSRVSKHKIVSEERYYSKRHEPSSKKRVPVHDRLSDSPQASPSFFELCGKIVVMGLLGVTFLALLLLIFTPSVGTKVQSSDNATEPIIENENLENRVANVYEKMREGVVFIVNWIRKIVKGLASSNIDL